MGLRGLPPGVPIGSGTFVTYLVTKAFWLASARGPRLRFCSRQRFQPNRGLPRPLTSNRYSPRAPGRNDASVPQAGELRQLTVHRQQIRQPNIIRSRARAMARGYCKPGPLLRDAHEARILLLRLQAAHRNGHRDNEGWYHCRPHSPEHALEHAKGEKIGSARKPNLRRREDIASRLLNTNASATTAMPHGGHPTPSPPTSATTTSSSKTPTLMESTLGELASKYKLAPHQRSLRSRTTRSSTT